MQRHGAQGERQTPRQASSLGRRGFKVGAVVRSWSVWMAFWCPARLAGGGRGPGMRLLQQFWPGGLLNPTGARPRGEGGEDSEPPTQGGCQVSGPHSVTGDTPASASFSLHDISTLPYQLAGRALVAQVKPWRVHRESRKSPCWRLLYPLPLPCFQICWCHCSFFFPGL